jgi:thiamine-phosphate pyrophosphorylase
MASHPRHGSAPDTPRFYLVTPAIDDPTGLAEFLPAALDAADIAAVLLRLAPADERTLIKRIKSLAPAIQDKDVAVIVDGHPEIVARAGADGCHITGVAGLRDVAPMIKPARILGAGGLTLRDDAMTAGEAGVDYVMFGEPESDGSRPSLGAIIDRVSWWAEVFEIPCVAYAAHMDEIEQLCEAGADFIAFGDTALSGRQDFVYVVREAGQRLKARAPA